MNRTVVSFGAILTALALRAEFRAGFSRVDMTPPIGTGLSGYSERRVSDGTPAVPNPPVRGFKVFQNRPYSGSLLKWANATVKRSME